MLRTNWEKQSFPKVNRVYYKLQQMEGCRLDENSPKHNTGSRVKRTITVHASSEVACPPDLYSLAISVSSTKENAEAAQNSVKRRSEYILQVLRNNSIKEKQVERSTDVNRVSENEICVQVNLLVRTGSLQACEAARNLLIEKMDVTVQCNAIDLLHSPAHKTEKRRQAFKEAVANAKQKAVSVAKMLEVRLGPALEVEEKSHHEVIATASYNGTTGCQQHPDMPSVQLPASLSLHERLRNSTMVYVNHVEAKFEVSPLRNCHHRKCPKH